jgi:hypothetical protein
MFLKFSQSDMIPDSGHGAQIKDKNGDERDGEDELIFPVDFKRAGQILDDDMHAIMVEPLPPGCRLTALFDVSHHPPAVVLLLSIA